jgi:hypothetical protein
VRNNSWRQYVPIEPIEYYRHFLFAHNRYMFIWDCIDYSIYPSQLRINCLSQSVTIDGSHMRFQGVDDVDLVVQMVTPQTPTFHEALMGPMRYLLCMQDCQRDYQWVCQPVGAREQEFTVTSSEHLITITGVDLHGIAFEDHLIHAKGDFGATVLIGDTPYRLEGHLALVHREVGREETMLLDAQTCEPVAVPAISR